MPIEKIACPRLNERLVIEGADGITSPRGEVFVEFNNNDFPMNIMCDHYYQQGNKCDLNNNNPCTYEFWKSMK